MQKENEVNIHIIVEITRTEKRTLDFHEHHAKGREIKERAGVPLEAELFAIRGDRFHPVPNDETVGIKNDELFVVIPRGAIHYAVNDEPQWTEEKELTPKTIMERAGVDPAGNYLEEIRPHKESFKDKAEIAIKLHDGMRFITVFTGPKPVSNS